MQTLFRLQLKAYSPNEESYDVYFQAPFFKSEKASDACFFEMVTTRNGNEVVLHCLNKGSHDHADPEMPIEHVYASHLPKFDWQSVTLPDVPPHILDRAEKLLTLDRLRDRSKQTVKWSKCHVRVRNVMDAPDYVRWERIQNYRTETGNRQEKTNRLFAKTWGIAIGTLVGIVLTLMYAAYASNHL